MGKAKRAHVFAPGDRKRLAIGAHKGPPCLQGYARQPGIRRAIVGTAREERAFCPPYEISLVYPSSKLS
ncbi:hypothetical protein AOQ71_03850 [Bradyrhizobium manausense]|uniref:Uncharacterized protein n=1 Tax=Bradyrhizobium manausense TaxID=989370 RepID=A0A0R3E580_9BRAD|nr:hypothetical protein AOQ71_03850 [Bradyrhizobium manausense]